MFKNAIIYRIKANLPALSALEEALQKETFQPCGATQEQSSGWVPPRGEAHGALVESVGGQWMLRFHSRKSALEIIAGEALEKPWESDPRPAPKPLPLGGPHGLNPPHLQPA